MIVNYIDLGLYNGAEIEIFYNLMKRNFSEIPFKIYGVEADVDFFKKVNEKFKSQKEVEIFNYAISNKDFEKIKLYVCDSNKGLGSSIFETKNNVNKNKFKEVESIKFSTFLNVAKVDLKNNLNILKFNIEGAELYLLRDLIKENFEIFKSFNIFCGHTSKNVNKVQELSNYYSEYDDLYKQLPEFIFFCTNDVKRSERAMTDSILKKLK